MEPQLPASSTTYSVLHSLPDEHLGGDTSIGEPLSPIPEGDLEQADDQDDDDEEDYDHHHKHKHSHKEIYESFDFNDNETLMWRKHQFRRYFQGKGKFWTASRISTFWKWFLVILTGVLIGFTGGFVAVFSEVLIEWKFESCYKLTEEGNFAAAFFAYHCISVFFSDDWWRLVLVATCCGGFRNSRNQSVLKRREYSRYCQSSSFIFESSWHVLCSFCWTAFGKRRTDDSRRFYYWSSCFSG
jgi:hypothetical protein